MCVSVPGPRRVEQLQVLNVSSSQVWLRWLVQAARHAAVSQVRVSLMPSDGSGARTALLNASTTEHSFRSGSALCFQRPPVLQNLPLKRILQRQFVKNLHFECLSFGSCVHVHLATTRGHCLITPTNTFVWHEEVRHHVSFFCCNVRVPFSVPQFVASWPEVHSGCVDAKWNQTR